MVPVPEEASPIGKTTSNASCIEGGHIASTLLLINTMVWNNDKVPNPELPSPETYGWTMDKGMFYVRISVI